MSHRHVNETGTSWYDKMAKGNKKFIKRKRGKSSDLTAGDVDPERKKIKVFFSFQFPLECILL